MKPSRSTLTLILGLTGLAIAGYLTWVHYQESALICGVGDCELVQSSDYSEIAGLPIALGGTGVFAMVVGLTVLSMWRPSLETQASIGVFFLALTSTFYYVYLTWIEVAVLQAVCQWCVLSSLMMVGILLNESVHLWRGDAVSVAEDYPDKRR